MTRRRYRVTRTLVTLRDGPLNNERVRLTSDTGFTTLPLAPLRGFPAGRYVNGKWTTSINQLELS